MQNPNWQEADQLAIYKRGWGVELGSTKKQLRRPNHSTTLPHVTENTAVNKQNESKVEKDAFEWLLHNLQNTKQLTSPWGFIIPASTPKILLHLRVILYLFQTCILIRSLIM